jgi:diguanylate cyclase (GGDEF)-like protein/PAS domain S-box-containing protein
MRNGIKGIWSQLTAPAAELRGEERQQAVMLARMLLAFILFAISVELVISMIGVLTERVNTHLRITLVSCVFLFICYLFSRTRYYKVGLWFFLIISSLATFLVAFSEPQPMTEVILSMLVIPLLVSSLYISFSGVIGLGIGYLVLIHLVTWLVLGYGQMGAIFNSVLFIVGVTFVIVFVTYQRIAMEKNRQRIIQQQREKYQKLVETSSDSILQVSPSLGVLFANATYYLSVGYTPEDSIVMPGLQEVLNQDLKAIQKVMPELQSNPQTQLEYKVRHRDGKFIHRLVNYALIRNEEGEVESITAAMRDFSERKLFEEKLAYIALHDPLTGLPNRTLIMDRLTQALKKSDRSGQQVAVLFLDVDHFKQINDSLGHPEGDLFLKVIANRLQRNIRSCDSVGRWSGDEFVLILEDICNDEWLQNFANKILTLLVKPYVRDNEEFFVSASIGICLSKPQIAPMRMIEQADQALYVAKRSGKNKFEIFKPVEDAQSEIA